MSEIMNEKTIEARRQQYHKDGMSFLKTAGAGILLSPVAIPFVALVSAVLVGAMALGINASGKNNDGYSRHFGLGVNALRVGIAGGAVALDHAPLMACFNENARSFVSVGAVMAGIGMFCVSLMAVDPTIKGVGNLICAVNPKKGEKICDVANRWVFDPLKKAVFTTSP